MIRLAVVLAATLLLTTAPAAAAKLRVAPSEVLEGDPVSIEAVGLPPGARATVHAQSVALTATGEKRAFHAQAVFAADATGRIDLASAAPIAGDYRGTDLRGLFWSQVLLAKDPERQARIAGLGLPDAAALQAEQVALALEVDGAVVGRATLTFAPAPGLKREEVRAADGLVGAFYTAKGARRRPVVVILSGSEGGLDYADWLGPKLAARGYAVFGLAYFAPGTRPMAGVPTALNRIPVELLEKVRAWLAARPEADVERFGLVGASKGGEFALVLASTYGWVDAAVAFTPSNLVTQGFQYGTSEEGMGSSWSRGGRDLPFLPQTGMRAEMANFRIPSAKVRMARVREANEAAASPELLEAAAIPVECSRAALLMLGGQDDRTGASGRSVERLGERLARHRYPRPFDAVVYSGAGHLIVDTGWRPTTTHGDGRFEEGGSPAADAHAQADGWTRMLAFLARELRP